MRSYKILWLATTPLLWSHSMHREKDYGLVYIAVFRLNIMAEMSNLKLDTSQISIFWNFRLLESRPDSPKTANLFWINLFYAIVTFTRKRWSRENMKAFYGATVFTGSLFIKAMHVLPCVNIKWINECINEWMNE